MMDFLQQLMDFTLKFGVAVAGLQEVAGQLLAAVRFYTDFILIYSENDGFYTDLY